MIKGRKLDHIGLAVTDLEASKNWYCDVLGFEVIGHFYADETPAYFLKNGDTVYEMYEEAIAEAVQGKIDHISFVSEDIEADYAYCPGDAIIRDRFENVCPCGEGAVADVIYKKIPEFLG